MDEPLDFYVLESKHKELVEREAALTKSLLQFIALQNEFIGVNPLSTSSSAISINSLLSSPLEANAVPNNVNPSLPDHCKSPISTSVDSSVPSLPSGVDEWFYDEDPFSSDYFTHSMRERIFNSSTNLPPKKIEINKMWCSFSEDISIKDYRTKIATLLSFIPDYFGRPIMTVSKKYNIPMFIMAIFFIHRPACLHFVNEPPFKKPCFRSMRDLRLFCNQYRSQIRAFYKALISNCLNIDYNGIQTLFSEKRSVVRRWCYLIDFSY